jgi:hypothetical protein
VGIKIAAHRAACKVGPVTSAASPRSIGKASSCKKPLFCTKRRPSYIRGKYAGTKPCGSPKCSRECRAKWGKKAAACLTRAFKECRPDITVRLTAFGLSDLITSDAERRFLRRLSYNGHEYFFIREWMENGTGRHIHIIIRSSGGLTTKQVGAWWRKSLASVEGSRAGAGTHYTDLIRNVKGLARYLPKDIRAGGSLVPELFPGRVFGYSRGFLPRPWKTLWREVRAEWYPE